MSQVLTFSPYSPARFELLRTALAAKGLTLTGDVGDVKEFGADVSYEYGNNVLTLLVRSPLHFHSMPSFTLELSKVVNGVPA